MRALLTGMFVVVVASPGPMVAQTLWDTPYGVRLVVEMNQLLQDPNVRAVSHLDDPRDLALWGNFSVTYASFSDKELKSFGQLMEATLASVSRETCALMTTAPATSGGRFISEIDTGLVARWAQVARAGVLVRVRGLSPGPQLPADKLRPTLQQLIQSQSPSDSARFAAAWEHPGQDATNDCWSGQRAWHAVGALSDSTAGPIVRALAATMVR